MNLKRVGKWKLTSLLLQDKFASDAEMQSTMKFALRNFEFY